MLKMSFYDGTLKKEEAKAFLTATDKPILYTYGLKYRNPTTRDVPKTKTEALSILDRAYLLDITEYPTHVDMNEFSSNDMW